MNIEIFQVDAFTDVPFKGNPAGVCLLSSEPPDSWMQNIAMEMNLAETAFLTKTPDGFHLRWFTPAVEVDLCGHATLASSHMLYEQGIAPKDQPIHFSTRSGILTARYDEGWIEIDLPNEACTPSECPQAIPQAIHTTPLFVGINRRDYLIEVESEDIVRNLQPDLNALQQLNRFGAVVTAKANPGSDYDYIARCFFPNFGIDEDPVTGSSHAMLAPYWAEKLGRKELVGYQASRRGGYLHCRVAGDRVFLKGKAVTTIKGTLLH